MREKLVKKMSHFLRNAWPGLDEDFIFNLSGNVNYTSYTSIFSQSFVKKTGEDKRSSFVLITC